MNPKLARARAAAGARRFARAAELCAEHLREHPESGVGHHLFGRVLSELGRNEEAIAHLRRAIELSPKNVRFVGTLAGLLERVRQYAPALELRERLCELQPRNGEHHADVAALQEILGRLDAAKQSVERAVRLVPQNAKARALQVKIALRMSALEPGQLELASDTLLKCARSRRPDVRALAFDALVDLCEHMEDYDAAFESMKAMNRTDREVYPRRIPSPARREAYLSQTRELAAGMTSERFRRWEQQRPDDGLVAPALLVGFPRSGTTMTERALAAHPRVRSIEERATFGAIKGKVPRLVGPEATKSMGLGEVLETLTPDHLGELRRLYWERVREVIGEVGDDQIVLDKLPLRIMELPFVCRVFPRARIIVALRDPRDACLSCFRQRFDVVDNAPMSFFLDLNDTARLYAHVMSLWLETREAYPCWKEIRYEETVEDFEGRMREVLEFLGLEWDEAVLSFHERTGRESSTTPSYHAIRQSVYQSAVGRWRNYASQLAPILPTLEPFVEALGYGEAPGG